jgi:hypothetical protein
LTPLSSRLSRSSLSLTKTLTLLKTPDSINLLVKCGVHSLYLASYWSNVEYILCIWPPIGHVWSIFSVSAWPPIGHMLSIFSVSGLLLVTCGVYSLYLASYWSHVEYILCIWPPTGHMWSIFSVSGLLLVTCGVYSLYLASYWSHVEYILCIWPPTGRMWSKNRYGDYTRWPNSIKPVDFQRVSPMLHVIVAFKPSRP